MDLQPIAVVLQLVRPARPSWRVDLRLRTTGNYESGGRIRGPTARVTDTLQPRCNTVARCGVGFAHRCFDEDVVVVERMFPQGSYVFFLSGIFFINVLRASSPSFRFAGGWGAGGGLP